MDEKQRKFQANALSDEELDVVIGGVTTSSELVRCAFCSRGFAAGCMYTYNGQKCCSKCYHTKLTGGAGR